MPALLKNTGLNSLPLPYPFGGVLAPGERTVVDATPEEVLAALGPLAGDSTLKVEYVAVPDSYDAYRLAFLSSGGYRSPGVPMQNRLRMLGAPGAIVEGNTVTIGNDVYEFRGSTPPAGGTAGRIWVYNGADSAASRANFIKAVNGTVDAAVVTRDGQNTEFVVAQAGVTLGDVVVQSADAIGGTPSPSATAIACSESLATATDIWDAANTYQGELQASTKIKMVSLGISANMIAKGTAEVFFDFTPTSCQLLNRSRPQNEAYVITGNAVSLTLAGGASPNNQADDVVDIIVVG